MCAATAVCVAGAVVPCAVAPGTHMGVGACSAGRSTCVADQEFGVWGECTGAGSPSDETCDGKDNDCNGLVDEVCACNVGEEQSCGSNVGACRFGAQQCVDGAWSACSGSVEPTAEVCDGEDNDCNGLVDEVCDCTSGATRPCGSDTGMCKSGVQRCIDGHWSSTCEGEIKSSAEVCDAQRRDENCDGQANERCQCDAGQTRECTTPGASCVNGTQACIDGRWTSQCTAVRECPAAEFSCGNAPHLWGAQYAYCSDPSNVNCNYLMHNDVTSGRCDTPFPSCQITAAYPDLYMDCMSPQDFNRSLYGDPSFTRQISAAMFGLQNVDDLKQCFVAWGFHPITRLEVRNGGRWVQTGVRGAAASNALRVSDPFGGPDFRTRWPAALFPSNRLIRPANFLGSGNDRYIILWEEPSAASIRGQAPVRAYYYPQGNPDWRSFSNFDRMMDFVLGTEFRGQFGSKVAIPFWEEYYRSRYGHTNLMLVAELICERINGQRIHQGNAIVLGERFWFNSSNRDMLPATFPLP